MKYTVLLWKTVRYIETLTIDATSEEDAQDKSLEQADHLDWTEDRSWVEVDYIGEAEEQGDQS